jgi:D-glutamate N-acetyltransferase
MAPQRFLILADGDFTPMTSKTANSVIRYMPERVVGVVDHIAAGRTAHDVLGFGNGIPVVPDMQTGLALKPDGVMIGIAPVGGRLPEKWRLWLKSALEAGCDVWSGLHTFIGDDPMLAEAARAGGREIRDVRRPPKDLPVAEGFARLVEPMVLLTVGTDCNVGKMTCQLQLTRQLNDRKVRTRFVATGQTGIFIEGWGIAVDAVVADFIAGAAEWLVLEGAKNADIVMVEGQGSINHPGYSGVTLGLLHGSCPNAMILCHQATRAHLSEYRSKAWLPMAPLSEYVKLYEHLGGAVWPTRVIGICLNTYDMTDETARAACEAATRETGLPATDPVRFPDDSALLDAVLSARERYLKTGRC